MFNTRLAVAAIALGLLLTAGAAAAQEISTVPYSLGQIQDQIFRDAMIHYSPAYDSLPRDQQIAAYVNMYQVLHNGQTPPLSGPEASSLSRGRQVRTAPAGRRQYDPWNDPSYNPYREEFGVLSNMGAFRW